MFKKFIKKSFPAKAKKMHFKMYSMEKTGLTWHSKTGRFLGMSTKCCWDSLKKWLNFQKYGLRPTAGGKT